MKHLKSKSAQEEINDRLGMESKVANAKASSNISKPNSGHKKSKKSVKKTKVVNAKATAPTIEPKSVSKETPATDANDPDINDPDVDEASTLQTTQEQPLGADRVHSADSTTASPVLEPQPENQNPPVQHDEESSAQSHAQENNEEDSDFENADTEEDRATKRKLHQEFQELFDQIPDEPDKRESLWGLRPGKRVRYDAMGDAPPAYNAGRYKSGYYEASGGAGEVNDLEIHGANDEEYCDDEASDGAEEVNDQTIDGAHDDENSDDEASGGAGEVDDQTLDGAHDDAQEIQGDDDGQPPGHDGNVLADDEHDVALPEHQQEPPKTPVRQLTGANPDKSPASSDLFVTPFPWENMPEGQALIRMR